MHGCSLGGRAGEQLGDGSSGSDRNPCSSTVGTSRLHILLYMCF